MRTVSKQLEPQDSTSIHGREPIVLGRLAPGAMVGDYQVTRFLAQGGMGSVYAAVQPVIAKPVALKIIHPHLCAYPTVVERFVQEAWAVNHIHHPNIVDIFGIGELSDGRPWQAMELLTGETLAHRLEAGTMGQLEALTVLAQVARALVATHAAGVIHRDLKPENIFLSNSGGVVTAKLLDFGVAKLSSNGPFCKLTDPGVAMGTPTYMSPEHARGDDASNASDIYSLGVVAYEVLTQRLPFLANSQASLLYAHVHSKVVLPAHAAATLPVSVCTLLLAMLDKSPTRRPSTLEVVDALDCEIAVLRNAHAEPQAASTPPSARCVGMPNRWVCGIAGLVILVAVAVSLWLPSNQSESGFDPAAVRSRAHVVFPRSRVDVVPSLDVMSKAPSVVQAKYMATSEPAKAAVGKMRVRRRAAVRARREQGTATRRSRRKLSDSDRLMDPFRAR